MQKKTTQLLALMGIQMAIGCYSNPPPTGSNGAACLDETTDESSIDCHDVTPVPATIVGEPMPSIYLEPAIVTDGNRQMLTAPFNLNDLNQKEGTSEEPFRALYFRTRGIVNTGCVDSVYYKEYAGVPYTDPHFECLEGGAGQIQYSEGWSVFGVSCHDDGDHRVIMYMDAEVQYNDGTEIHEISTSVFEVTCYSLYSSDPEADRIYEVTNSGPWNLYEM